MPRHSDGASLRRPTPYEELNTVLAHLVQGVRRVLGDNLTGAYLQGSFAVGDFTPWSDCDFIVVTERDLTPDDVAGLNDLHGEIQRLPCPYWRRGLEGSYVPRAILRS